jgi:hypothetical protein
MIDHGLIVSRGDIDELLAACTTIVAAGTLVLFHHRDV